MVVHRSQVDNPTSLENIETKVGLTCLGYGDRGRLVLNTFILRQWLDEIVEHCPGVKVCYPSLERTETFWLTWS